MAFYKHYKKSKHEFLVESRRKIIAHFRVRGMTLREISDELRKDGIYNERTGKNISEATIFLDLKDMHKKFVQQQMNSMGELKAKQLMELDEVKKACLNAGKFSDYINALKHEAKILGLDMPEVINHTIDIKNDSALQLELISEVEKINIQQQSYLDSEEVCDSDD